MGAAPAVGISLFINDDSAWFSPHVDGCCFCRSLLSFWPIPFGYICTVTGKSFSFGWYLKLSIKSKVHSLSDNSGPKDTRWLLEILTIGFEPEGKLYQNSILNTFLAPISFKMNEVNVEKFHQPWLCEVFKAEL